MTANVYYPRAFRDTMATVKDPICGMMIDPKYAAGSSVHEGVTFYFCSPGCKRTFDKDPHRYAHAAH